MARYRFQTGSLFLRGKRRKVWVLRVREDVIEDGQIRRIKRSVVLGSLKEIPRRDRALERAKDVLDELKVNRASYRPRRVATFEQFAERWEVDILPNWKPSSATNARSHLSRYLVPFFGKTQLRDVGPEIIQRFISSLTVGPKTVRNVIMTLRSLLNTAKAWEYVSHDAFNGLVLPGIGHRERFFFSMKEVQRIIEATEEPHRTFYWLAAETGLRAGELCGLRVDDLDVENCVVRIRQSVWRGKEQTTKSRNAVREEAISPELATHLAEYLRTWRPNSRRLVFATRKGTPWLQDMLLKRHFRPLVKRLGITVPKGSGLHAFRHAMATEMDRQGVPLAIRSRRLGHSNIQVTLNTYTHAISEDERRFVSGLGRILAPLAPSLSKTAVQKSEQELVN
jgi:integrase